MKLYNHSTKD